MPSSSLLHLDLPLAGMTCAACAARIEKSLNKLPGVTAVHREQSRGNKPPIQFVFSFKLNNGGAE